MSRTDKVHALLTRLLVLLLVLFMLLIGLRFGTRFLLINHLGMDNAFTRLVMWDNHQLARPGLLQDNAQTSQNWWERYPFTVPTGQSTRLAGFLSWIDPLQDYIKRAWGKVANTVEFYTNEHLMFRQYIAESANQYDKLIGWNLAGYTEYNNVVEMGNGYLTTFSNWFDVRENAEAVADFKTYLDGRGIPLMFVQLPNKISRLQEGFNNFVDYYNNNANRLVQTMREKGVSVLDLRDNVEAQRLNHQALFFQHGSPLAAANRVVGCWRNLQNPQRALRLPD